MYYKDFAVPIRSSLQMVVVQLSVYHVTAWKSQELCANACLPQLHFTCCSFVSLSSFSRCLVWNCVSMCSLRIMRCQCSIVWLTLFFLHYSGAQGEYTGLRAIRAYHEHIGAENRKVWFCWSYLMSRLFVHSTFDSRLWSKKIIRSPAVPCHEILGA